MPAFVGTSRRTKAWNMWNMNKAKQNDTSKCHVNAMDKEIEAIILDDLHHPLNQSTFKKTHTSSLLLLVEGILHQLIGSLSMFIPWFTSFFYIPGGGGFLPSTDMFLPEPSETLKSSNFTEMPRPWKEACFPTRSNLCGGCGIRVPWRPWL